MNLKLKTNDNFVMNVPSEDLKISHLMQILMESFDHDSMKEEIPLYNISYAVLVKIIEFTTHYNKDPMKQVVKPLPNNHDLGVQTWYKQYIERLSDGELHELLKGSTYMDIEPLTDLLCGQMASIIKGKEPDELKTIFGLDYDN